MTMTRLPPFSPRFGLVAVLALCPVASLAQGQDDLDVTMRMVLDDSELSERVVQELELPEPVRMAPGRPEFDGRDRAAEARSQGRALGEQISGQARSNRENLPTGRPDGQLDLPPGLERGGETLPDLGPDGNRGRGRNELPEPNDLLGPDLPSERDPD